MGGCFNKCNEEQAEALRHAADAEDRAKQVVDPTLKSDHQRMAHSWHVLARAYEFQHALERFIYTRQPVSRRASAGHSLQHAEIGSGNRKPDFFDQLAQKADAIRPFSAAALSIAVGAVSLATLLRWLSGFTVADLRFGIYVAAILGTGLLAGVPAAIGAAAISIFIVVFAFVPPHLSFKIPGAGDQISLAFAALASMITIYFAHCCRVVLRRLHKKELANQMLVNELEHRGRNMFSVNQVILQKSLADQPQRAEQIIGRFRAVQNANSLLTKKTARPITIAGLLSVEFAPHGEHRLIKRGPEVEVEPDAVRHLLLLLHELVTNAAKFGALSAAEGLILVDWRWNGGRRVSLTWRESGGPKVLVPTKKGFGSQLIASCVQAFDMSFGRNGYSCNMTLRIR